MEIFKTEIFLKTLLIRISQQVYKTPDAQKRPKICTCCRASELPSRQCPPIKYDTQEHFKYQLLYAIFYHPALHCGATVSIRSPVTISLQQLVTLQVMHLSLRPGGLRLDTSIESMNNRNGSTTNVSATLFFLARQECSNYSRETIKQLHISLPEKEEPSLKVSFFSL